jgi:hypothetical protein
MDEKNLAQGFGWRCLESPIASTGVHGASKFMVRSWREVEGRGQRLLLEWKRSLGHTSICLRNWKQSRVKEIGGRAEPWLLAFGFCTCVCEGVGGGGR